MTDQADAIMLGGFVVAVLIGIWRMARRDAFYAGFAVFFLVYTIFAMVGYRFYPLLSMVLSAYFGVGVYYDYFWFVAASFGAFFIAFRLFHRRLLGNDVFDVAYRPRETAVWTVLLVVVALTAWMAVTLVRIYATIDYNAETQIPYLPFALAFKNSHYIVLILYVFARKHARTSLERFAGWTTASGLGLIFLLTALKAGNRTDLLALALALLWLEIAPVILTRDWGLRIRLDRPTLTRFAGVAVAAAGLWFALDAVKAARGPSPLGALPTYAAVLFNDYFAPAHILFGLIGMHHVRPLFVLESNVANSLHLGSLLHVPYLQAGVTSMMNPWASSQDIGYAYYIFGEGYMAFGPVLGVLYNGVVPLLFIALWRRLARTPDLEYNAFVGALGAMFFPNVARNSTHLMIRSYLFVLLPSLFLFRFLTGARLRYAGKKKRLP